MRLGGAWSAVDMRAEVQLWAQCQPPTPKCGQSLAAVKQMGAHPAGPQRAMRGGKRLAGWMVVGGLCTRSI